MKSKLFQLIGIDSPGRIEMYGFGRVNLSEASDETLQAMYAKGCHFIVPTELGRKQLYPDMPTLEINSTPFAVIPEEIPEPKKVETKTKRRRA